MIYSDILSERGAASESEDDRGYVPLEEFYAAWLDFLKPLDLS